MELNFSAAEYRRRVEAVRALMAAEDVECLLVFGSRGAGHEVLHLSGYLVSGEAILVLPGSGEPVLLVHFPNHVPDARRLSVVEDVRPRGDDAVGAALGCLRERRIDGRVAVAGPLSHQRHAGLVAALSAGRVVDLGSRLTALRLRKSEEEMGFIRRGAELTDRALRALAAEARPGMTEHDLVAILESAYLPLGGTTHIHYLGTTSMAAPDLCVPRQFPTGRRLRAGDAILTEVSAQHQGYYGQALRTFTVGADPTPEYGRLHAAAVRVFDDVAAVIRAGASSEAVLDVAEQIHGAGWTIYDDLLHCAVGGVYAPYLRTRRTAMGPTREFHFEEDMVIVVQPNVITPDERAGVQVGDMLRVTASGVEGFHSLPREIVRCG